MSASAPHSAKLIANVAILTPDRALLVKYREGHDGDGGWMLPDDLLADPEELTNLAFDPQHSATVKKLRAAAIAELKRTGAKMVDSLPPVANVLASE